MISLNSGQSVLYLTEVRFCIKRNEILCLHPLIIAIFMHIVGFRKTFQRGRGFYESVSPTLLFLLLLYCYCRCRRCYC